jgi:hypothetical protein
MSVKLQRFGSYIYFCLQVKRKRKEALSGGPLLEQVSDLDRYGVEVPGAKNGCRLLTRRQKMMIQLPKRCNFVEM